MTAPTVNPDEVPAMAAIGGPDCDTIPIPQLRDLCKSSAAAASMTTQTAQQKATEAVTDIGAKATSGVFSAVMGPIAEIGLTLVLAGAGAALVIWGVIQLAKTTGAADAAKSTGDKVGQVAMLAAL